MKRKFAGHGAIVASIGTLTLAVGGVGIAAASNGGSLILGQPNDASSTTTLKDPNGTPLALVGPDGKPPLAVSNDQLVKHLNADQLRGLTPSDLSAGSFAELAEPILKDAVPIVDLPAAGSGDISSIKPVSVFETAKLDAGTYAVDASVFGQDAICWVDTNSTTRREEYSTTSSNVDSAGTANIVVTITVDNGEHIHTYCAALPTSLIREELAKAARSATSRVASTIPNMAVNIDGQVSGGGMTAIRLLSNQRGPTAQTTTPPAPVAP